MRDHWVFDNGNDEMEIGETGFIPVENGWMINKSTGESRDPDGRVYDSNGEVIFDPQDEMSDDDWNEESDEYEYYDQ